MKLVGLTYACPACVMKPKTTLSPSASSETSSRSSAKAAPANSASARNDTETVVDPNLMVLPLMDISQQPPPASRRPRPIVRLVAFDWKYTRAPAESTVRATEWVPSRPWHCLSRALWLSLPLARTHQRPCALAA